MQHRGATLTIIELYPQRTKVNQSLKQVIPILTDCDPILDLQPKEAILLFKQQKSSIHPYGL